MNTSIDLIIISLALYVLVVIYTKEEEKVRTKTSKEIFSKEAGGGTG